jgi:hypothetical protein
MRTLTPEEFKRLYGENALAGFTAPQRDTTTRERLANVGNSTAQTIQENIQGTGQFAGQSPLRRGIQATAAGFSAVPRGALALSPEAVRTGVEFAGDKIQQGFGKVTNTIGNTELFKGAAGREYTDPNTGVSTYTQNDLGMLEEGLGIAAAGGEIAGNILGAGETALVGNVLRQGVGNAAKGIKVPKTNADEVFREGVKLRDDVRAYVGEKTVDPQVKASAERLVENPTFLKGTAERTEDVVTKYDRYLSQSQNAINDIKVDPAISEVGSKMGDAFEDVLEQRRVVGKALGDELNEWGKLRVSVKQAVDDTLAELDASGLSYNPRTRQLTSFQGSKFVPQEVDMLNDFFNRSKLLGDSPTVRQLDQFIARTRTSLDFTKGESGVMGITNAERIINGALAQLKDSLNPDKNGIQQLSKYWQANKTYSELSDFVEEGTAFLGKKTQSGDFAKDASVAKSAVQSILNSGKKDWMVKLEALTDYNALDDAVLALQAMKDAGDFRGLSLLQAMKDSGIPTSKAGFTGAIIDKAVDIGKRVVAGTPADQTRAFLKSLNAKKANLSIPDKKVVATKGIPKTKEITELEDKIAKNVTAQKVAIKAGKFEVVAKLKEVYEQLVKELKDLVADYKKNGIPLGMSIRKTVTPESVAKKADKQDIRFLAAVIDDVKAARTSPDANKLLNEMGLGKATDDELVSFAKEVIDEADGVADRAILPNDQK